MEAVLTLTLSWKQSIWSVLHRLVFHSRGLKSFNKTVVQYQNEKYQWADERLNTKEFQGTAALVGSLVRFHFGMEPKLFFGETFNQIP